MSASTIEPTRFWPDGAPLVVSVSMQFEAGAQPDRAAQGPFPPLDQCYPDLPMQKWYEYGFKEGIPRPLELWDAKGIKVTSRMVGQAVERHPQLARDIVARSRSGRARPDLDATIFDDARRGACQLHSEHRRDRAGDWNSPRRVQRVLVARHATNA